MVVKKKFDMQDRNGGIIKCTAFAVPAAFQRKQGTIWGHRNACPSGRLAAEQKRRPRLSRAADQDLKLIAGDGSVISAWKVTPMSQAAITAYGRGVVLLSDVLGYENEDTRAFATALSEFGISVSAS
jgi:hypothetical protein